MSCSPHASHVPGASSASSASGSIRAISIADVRAARRAFIAPLFAYMADHCMSAIALARRAAAAAHAPQPRRPHVTNIKNGLRPPPAWFIAGMCREIGQPIETVMGQEWAQQHLPQPDAPDTSGASDTEPLHGEREKKAS